MQVAALEASVAVGLLNPTSPAGMRLNRRRLDDLVAAVGKYMAEADYFADTLRMAHVADVDDVLEQHAAAVEKLWAAHAEEVTALREAHAAQLAALRSEHGEAVRALQERATLLQVGPWDTPACVLPCSC